MRLSGTGNNCGNGRRKISEEAAKALLMGKPYKKDNTQVLSIGDGNYIMKLFGNTIANCKPSCRWESPQSLRICDGRHQSKTTKERLNALPSVNIYQKNFQWYINDCKWEDAYNGSKECNPYGWIDVIVDYEDVIFKKNIPPVVIKQIKYSAKTYEELRKQYRTNR